VKFCIRNFSKFICYLFFHSWFSSVTIFTALLRHSAYIIRDGKVITLNGTHVQVAAGAFDVSHENSYSPFPSRRNVVNVRNIICAFLMRVVMTCAVNAEDLW